MRKAKAMKGSPIKAMSTTEPGRWSLTGAWGAWAAVLMIGATACAAPVVEEPTATVGDTWSVTAWGKHYEVFPEVDVLIAGEIAVSHTHVTQLAEFAPLNEGTVEIVLAGPSGEEVFRSDQPSRPGLFNVEVLPAATGERELLFRITGPEGSEEIRGGKVRVGTSERPGGIVVAPAPKGASDGGEPLALLKEEQWRSEFATGWVRTGQLARSVSGLARVRPPAGGDLLLTSPVDGVLRSASSSAAWPFVGLAVDRGRALFKVVPRVAVDRSLASLEAELTGVDAKLVAASARYTRLQELLALEATSQREVDDAEVKVETLGAARAAAERDLAAARSARQGKAAEGFVLRAPFRGKIAAVEASVGLAVTAGEPLARLVQTDRLWLDVAITPSAARELADQQVVGVVLRDADQSPLRVTGDLRLISMAPEVSPETGTVSVFIEMLATPGVMLGTTLQAQILLGETRQGIVIPASALVDDGGVPVVYLQLSGESFARQEVRVLERQGDHLLVERLTPGQRLVSRGGEVLRRSSLMSSGAAHGHVH